MKNFMKAMAIVCALGIGLSVASAQAPQAPAPGAEHQKLAYFVGTWQSEGEMMESPMGPGGKTSSKDRCEWFEGKFAVVCHYDGAGPMGPMKGIGILGYSPEDKVYTFYGLDNSGMTMLSIPRGVVQGKTWTYNDEMKMGGQSIKNRYIIEQVSEDSYTFRWEVEGEGGAWNTIAKGKSTRVQSTAKD